MINPTKNFTHPRLNLSGIATKRKEEKDKFEKTWHRKWAFIPVMLSSGKWICWNRYWVRYQAEILLTKPGRPRRMSQYLTLSLRKGKMIERIDDYEMTVRKLQEC